MLNTRFQLLFLITYVDDYLHAMKQFHQHQQNVGQTLVDTPLLID